MQYFDKHLKLNPSARVQKYKNPYKVKFTASSSVKKLENDGPDALKDLLIKTKEKFFSPQPVLNRIEARLDFFESYKKVSMTERRSNFENNSKNAYLQKLSKNNLNPKPFGMIKFKEQESCIDLHCYSMGDEYATAFAEGLRSFKNLESLNLRSNRLSDKGSYAIMSTLDVQPIRYLSLCDNILGTKALGCLFSLLRNPKQCLKHLNLENTRLSSSDVINLVSIISTNKSLSFLSLAKNNIHHHTSKAIKEMLHYNESLKKLDLHWNTLKIEGAVLILEGLQDNNTLQSLDLSWNAIGNNRNPQLTSQLSKLLGKQGTLRHLDLSNNYLNSAECENIGSGLINDHKLLIHMEGNECFVDAKGFIISAGYVDQTKSQHISKVLLDDENSQGGLGSNCWICEKWVQFKFIYNEKCESPLFIHLECDRYVPEMMNQSNNHHFLDRVIPSGKLKFFFSNLTAPFKSPEYKFEVLPSMLELQAKYSINLQIPIRIVYMNYIETNSTCFKKIEDFESRLREPGLKYFSPSLELVRIEWKFENSIFRDYAIPDDLSLEDCFEFDWKLSKLTTMIKNPLQQTQLFELLKSDYKQIYHCYKYLSALSGYDVFAIGVNVLNEYLQLWKVFDGLYRISDLGVNWSACVVAKDKKQGFGIGNCIVRFQFMEILVRIASDRFVRNRICSNVVDATRKFLEESFIPSTQEYLLTNTWRSTHYFCEEIDLIFKAHKEILDSIYKKYSGSKALPGQKPFMSLEEFHQFCSDTKLENEKLTSREIDLNFVQSMMVQVDEINKKRHLEMSFVEFLEGFARCCFISGPAKTSLISEIDQIRRLSGLICKVPLAQIIEKYMPNLLRLCPASLRENFVYPTSETYKKMMYKVKNL